MVMDEVTTAEQCSGVCSSFSYIYNGWSRLIFNNINNEAYLDYGQFGLLGFPNFN